MSRRHTPFRVMQHDRSVEYGTSGVSRFKGLLNVWLASSGYIRERERWWAHKDVLPFHVNGSAGSKICLGTIPSTNKALPAYPISASEARGVTERGPSVRAGRMHPSQDYMHPMIFFRYVCIYLVVPTKYIYHIYDIFSICICLVVPTKFRQYIESRARKRCTAVL